LLAILLAAEQFLGGTRKAFLYFRQPERVFRCEFCLEERNASEIRIPAKRIGDSVSFSSEPSYDETYVLPKSEPIARESLVNVANPMFDFTCLQPPFKCRLWYMEASENKEESTQNVSTILLSPERLESVALKRILAEVADERDLDLAPNRYDRDHNRHNR
jgi:hypothetical protein